MALDSQQKTQMLNAFRKKYGLARAKGNGRQAFVPAPAIAGNTTYVPAPDSLIEDGVYAAGSARVGTRNADSVVFLDPSGKPFFISESALTGIIQVLPSTAPVVAVAKAAWDAYEQARANGDTQVRAPKIQWDGSPTIAVARYGKLQSLSPVIISEADAATGEKDEHGYKLEAFTTRSEPTYYVVGEQVTRVSERTGNTYFATSYDIPANCVIRRCFIATDAAPVAGERTYGSAQPAAAPAQPAAAPAQPAATTAQPY